MTAKDSPANEPPAGASPWEGQAANWTAWARVPGHDVFPAFAPSFFEDVLPEADGLTLEIGCGEGRVARELASRGHRVVALDVSPSLARNAREAGDGPSFAVGDATALPFADGTFGTAVAYNSLQAMWLEPDMARAVREAGRVLQPGGRFCLCVAHPMTDIGHVKRVSPEGEMTIAGAYFTRRRVEETVTRDGLQMTFHGWTYTLEDYARALEDAGLIIERVREPLPNIARAEQHDLERWQRVPMFLSIRAVKRP